MVSTPARAARGLPGRPPPRWATASVACSLVLPNLAHHVLGWESVWLGPATAAALVAFARWCGLSWQELGLGRQTLGRGLRWGAGAVVAVGAVYAVGLLLPATRTAFLDTRSQLGLADALTTALLVIPLGTVLMEEVAFRSVLWGLRGRHAPTWQVAGGTSLLFGLWHVLPALDSTSNRAVSQAVGEGALGQVGLVAGTVVFTTVGGLVFGELRRRTGSVWAPVGLHWATNALGILAGTVAWRLR
jgi:uncharacterized protein